jgi:hypothetical protein
MEFACMKGDSGVLLTDRSDILATRECNRHNCGPTLMADEGEDTNHADYEISDK